jgi:acyl transferase domain-containing protein/NADPH:quinone reductase-like Zn-dependent oxidoreductase
MSERRNLLQESLAAIERLQARLDASERARHEPIAILGAGCRYPGGVETPADLWRLLHGGVDAVSEVPAERWDADAYYDPDPKAPGKMITRRGGFLGPVDGFDAPFFGISPREAATMDPQQRLLLETATEALESAGLATDRLIGSATGVFVGITTSDYGQLLRLGGPEHSDVYSATGSALNAAAGRISFTYGFQGPCMAVDTACSSSLVAVHLACQSLRAGESDLALAGGVNVVLSPDAMVLFSKWGMMAPDGACKTFDAAADGFVRAEGCAMIALKRLADAQAAGDPILAVIRGSAVNSDGRSSGLTVPNGPAQQAVLRKALANAALAPGDIDYIEAHGTGTPLGDPIEIEALGAVMGDGHSAERPLLVGSIKTNLGHTEAASGAAGLLKVVMALRHECIPPHLHFTTPNPRIPWADLPMRVPTSATAWPRGSRIRRAGVSSFGFSGTNAHVIVEEAPASPPMTSSDNEPRLIVLSARGDAALRAAALRQADYLASHSDVPLGDVAATLAAGRVHLEKRAACVADTTADAESALRSFAQGEIPPGLVCGAARLGERPKIAFLFTGQGSQYAGMGRQLYETEPVFRAALDRCAAILSQHLQRPLLEVLFPAPGVSAPLGETAYTQPALFALEYSLCELWRSWGITPSIVVGHSVGEYVAACIAGVFTLEDGLTLVATRGKLMQALPPGGTMAAIFAEESAVAARVAGFGDRVAIAAVNGPEETVVAGDAEVIEQIVARYTADGIKSRVLNVSHAFHSVRLEPMLDEFERRAAAVSYAAPRIPLVSNVTGTVFAADARPDARYWRRHARETVRFLSCIDSLRGFGATALLEVGPHPTLLALVARTLPEAKWATAVSLRQGSPERREMLASLGMLYTRGAAVKWDAIASGQGRRVALPTYPFQRERHWVEKAPAERRVPAFDGHPLLGSRQRSPNPGAQFLAEVAADQPAWLAEHVVLGHTLMPGTAYVEMALAAARETGHEGAVTLRHISVEAPLRLDPVQSTLVHLDVAAPDGDDASFVVRSSPSSADDGQWRVHAKGVIRQGVAASTGADAMPAIADIRVRCTTDADVADYYARLERLGLGYGPTFKALRALHIGDDEAVGLLEVAAAGDRTSWMLHPALLDAAFHVLGGVLLGQAGSGQDSQVYVPIGLDEVHVAEAVSGRVWVAGRVRAAGPDRSVRVADLRLEDESGRFVASVMGLRLRQVTAQSLARAVSASAMGVHTYAVRWQPAIVAETANDLKDQHYVLVGGNDGFASDVAQTLRQHGATCTVMSGAEALREAAIEADWIIDCAALEGGAAADDMWSEVRRRYSHLLGVAQALSGHGSQTGLCVVTRGAQAIAPGDEVDLTQAVLLGLARSVAAEQTGSPMARLDIDPAASPDPSAVLKALTAAIGGECEIGIRNGELFAPRLEESGTEARRDARSREVLRIRERGSFDGLQLQVDTRRAPAPGEVEIAVHAAGLNFRDLLNTLGMYPGDAGPLGSECSGIAVAVGDGVTHVRAGDEVVAFATDSMASHVTTSSTMVVRKPERITFCDAVTLPNAYLTAAYAFVMAGGVKRGQRVLVHAATGGVGLAALRLARRAGAEVIATAGSARKRAIALEEGAAYAFDSRSPSFADDVRRVTGGAGVDLVLNSLSGEFIAAGMGCVAAGGCFVEIGKGGIWTHDEAARRAPGVRYVVVDLGLAIRDDSATVRGMLEGILDEVAADRLAPLPLRTFTLSEAPAAFRYMAAARHVGKIVLVPAHEIGEAAPRVSASATYLVTGGVGGLGLATAEWLASRGAGEIVLVGRRTPSPEHEAQIARLRAAGARVTVVSCDIGDRDAVRALWHDVLSSRPPVRGIVHAAGVAADASLPQQDVARFDEVARAKITGAWHLHELSARHALDFFVLYSSASARFGSAGQVNYAAANSFLDGLAAYRRSRGQCATSIGWGAWDRVGMAARTSNTTRARWARAGIGFLNPEDAFPALEHVLNTTESYAAVMAIDPLKAVAQATAGVRALFGRHGAVLPGDADPEKSGAAAAPESASAHEPTLRERLRATVPNRRRTLLRDHVRQTAARVLGLARADRLNVEEPLGQLGLDSLMAVELRNMLAKAIGQALPATIIFEYPSVLALVDHLAATVFVAELEVPVETSTTPAVAAPPAALLENLSADELAAQLLSRLDGIPLPENS